MELDGITRVWLNMQEGELHDADGVVEVFPKFRDFDEGLDGDDALSLIADVDVTYELERGSEPLELGGVYPYWVTVTIVETGEKIRIEGVRPFDGESEIAKKVVSTAEQHLGKTGLTIMTGLETEP